MAKYKGKHTVREVADGGGVTRRNVIIGAGGMAALGGLAISGVESSGAATIPVPKLTASGWRDFSPTLSPGWKTNPFTGLKLNATEKNIITGIEKIQKSQPEWSSNASMGYTVLRRPLASGDVPGIPIITHSRDNWYSSRVGIVASGVTLRGHYVSLDWFMITDGAHKGEYIASGLLHRADLPIPSNGKLPQSSLATIPQWMRHYPNSSTDARYLNPQALKQLIWMNAAWRREFGVNYQLNQGYRSYALQMAIYNNLGPAVAAKPGLSNHELGLAIDIQSVTIGGSAGSKWMNAYSPAFGWQRPAVFDRRTTEYWHYNYVG